MRIRSPVMFAFLSSIFLLALSAAAQIEGPTPDRSRLEVAATRSYHDHSIRDIEAVGDRNIGCGRGVGNWCSLERQIEMGRRISREVETTSEFITDPVVKEYINQVGQNLVRNSDSQVPFRIRVIDSEEINAVALPGGFFYVYAGLILAAEDEAEPAGVMAHEIAHVAACHAARGRTREQLMHMASLPLMMISGPVGYAAYESLTIATPLTFMRFSRRFESEADFLGVQYMYKAGYDPQAFIAFFERIKNLDKRKENLVVKAFRTHPQTVERIERTQKEIGTLLPPLARYKVDSSEFREIKERLSQATNGFDTQRDIEHAPKLKHRMPSGSNTP